jgi:hypothetical protein
MPLPWQEAADMNRLNRTYFDKEPQKVEPRYDRQIKILRGYDVKICLDANRVQCYLMRVDIINKVRASSAEKGALSLSVYAMVLFTS